MTADPTSTTVRAPTFGVEEEYLIVDDDTGELSPLAPSLLRSINGGAGVGDVDAEAELMACAIETATGVCHTATEIHDDLIERRQALDLVARDHGVGLVGLGTHPFSTWKNQHVTTGSTRFSSMLRAYRLLAREQVICGFHVHIGIDRPDEVVSTMTRLRSWLAPVLALSGNSPMWEGLDSGYQSYRTVVWQRWPTARMPPPLPDEARYRDVVGELVRSGTIRDASHLYWYSRPSEQHPTLEIRIGDIATTAARTTALAALIRALAWRCWVDSDAVDAHTAETSNEVLEGAIWRAARHGVTTSLVSPSTLRETAAADVVAETLALARPCLDAAGDLPLVEAHLEAILADGTGADHQRALAASPSGPRPIVDHARHSFTEDAL